MAINQNHLAEELEGIKCAIVEKNTTQERAEFLRKILAFNGFVVYVVPSPPPKSLTAIAPKEPENAPSPPGELPPAPETFTVGVTDLTFNPVNAIFGRLLKMPGGQVVTLAFWQQLAPSSDDSVPYFELG